MPLPAVVSVAPDIALPRIPGMKDILAAGKKPSSVNAASDVEAAVVDVVETKAPQQAERKMEMLDASVDGDLEKFRGRPQSGPVVERWNHNESTRYR